MNKNAKTYLFAGITVLIVVVLFWLAVSSPDALIDVNPNDLAGIQTGAFPWLPENDFLKDRLTAIGLPVLDKEGAALHMHQHLDIFIESKSVPVPADIGVNETAGFISPVHAHEPNAIIHVESPTIQTFTLGQFFDIWGVRFTDQCIGGYCNSGDKVLRVYVNGSLTSGDPRKIALAQHQEIVVAYGADKDLPDPIPNSFAFPQGL